MPENLQFSGDFDEPPRWRFFPRTVFPPLLIQEGATGKATVGFRLTEQGYVEEAKVLEATHQAFGASALGTTGRMVFRPATKAGKPVSVQGTVSFTFEYQ